MKQISAFIENVPGTLQKVLQVLGKEDIQLRAISIADSEQYGICRILCNDEVKAFDLLQKNGYAASVSDVIAVNMNDRPGAAAELVSIMAEGGSNIAYLYSLALEGEPVLVFRTDDNDGARSLLSKNNIKEIC